jgi:hypothetical protein
MACLARTGSWGSSPRATPILRGTPARSFTVRQLAHPVCLQGEGGGTARTNPPGDIAAGYVKDL